MIVRLMPEQIAEQWEAIKHAACQSNAISKEIEVQYCNNLFELLLLEKYQCWLGFDTNEDGTKTYVAILITALIRDDVTGKNDLLLYGMYAFRALDNSMLIEGLETMHKFAAANNCGKVFGFTNNIRLLEFLKDNNFTSDTVRFMKEV